jgi:tetratricopeptide (TPR) repeat protein
MERRSSKIAWTIKASPTVDRGREDDMPTKPFPPSLHVRIFLAAAAFGAALGAAAPSGAGPRDYIGRTGDRVIVLGESYAARCYRHARFGRTDREALVDCDIALEHETSGVDPAISHVNRGIVRAARGDLEGALEDYQAAALSQPDLSEAHVNAARTYATLGQWRESESAFNRAIALVSETDAVDTLRVLHFDRAIAREELGDYAGAFEDYSRAAELGPEWEAPRLELERFQVVSDAQDGGA